MSDDKKLARKEAFARRRTAHGAGLDGAGQEALAVYLAPHAGKPLAGYMPIRTEINPLPVMALWDGPVGVPVIEGKGLPLHFHRWTPATKMLEGAFGAQIPETPEPMVPEILIVPLVAFDAKGYRLGYGGGFYDRTLEGLRSRGSVLAVGFAYAAQAVDALPVEATDQPLDAIVTEAGVTEFGRT